VAIGVKESIRARAKALRHELAAQQPAAAGNVLTLDRSKRQRSSP
jgi:hypothetical protein